MLNERATVAACEHSPAHSHESVHAHARHARTPRRRCKMRCVHAGIMVCEQLPSHRHRNLKAFEEHIENHVSVCFITE